jgi:hypothetical protein
MPALSGRFRASNLAWSALLCATFFFISCTGLRLPVDSPSYEHAQLLTASTAGVTVFAKPLISRQDYLDMFDDYLPEIGLVAVWVKVRNDRSSDINLAKNKWVLQTGNRGARQLDAPSILKRYYHGRKIRMYTLRSYTRTHQQIEQLIVPDGKIPSSMKLEGFVIFQIDTSMQQNWNKGAVLSNKGIYLDDQKKVEFRLSLDYANP